MSHPTPQTGATNPPRMLDRRVAWLQRELAGLIESVHVERRQRNHEIAAALPVHAAGAANLAHYIGLRKHDLRRLQLELAALGLSSLGRCEGHVVDTLLRIGGWLGTGQACESSGAPDSMQAEAMLHRNTRALFGPKPPGRHVAIMVTAPDATEATPAWADAIVQAGTDLLRINGAHETPAAWRRILDVYRMRAAAAERTARVFVDLPGPKLRADIGAGARAVLHLPRCKDGQGHTIRSTSILLVPVYGDGAQLPVPVAWVDGMQPGDLIRFEDAGGRPRTLRICERTVLGPRAECSESLYLMAGLPLTWQRNDAVLGTGTVGEFPESLRAVSLSPQDLFLLAADGRVAARDLAVLVCPEQTQLEALKVGERIVLDDGRLLATVEARVPDGWRCRVTRTLKTPLRVRAGKGIAFPDSELPGRMLGPQDEQALAFALECADGIEVSFVNTPEDVRQIAARLRAAARGGFGLVLKLETRQAMRNLPGILFEALRYDPVGIMIARGDLAVELSFERLAEMQEELLWFGEACHLPVIWATQVLDSLAHSGLPTRAEITDAAMSMRAECVMLNKGPQIAQAVQMLADIIGRMEAHQYKKRSLYRPLQLALGQPPGQD